ncbi:MAG: hypothetical protein WDO19_22500 [Bacteroidota bacterium]
MKKLFIILLLVTGMAIPGNGYAQSFTKISENISSVADEKSGPSFSFVKHLHAELELSVVHSGIFSSVNNVQKSGSGFNSILSCSLSYTFFQNNIPPIPAKGILPLYPDCIYPFHSFW